MERSVVVKGLTLPPSPSAREQGTQLRGCFLNPEVRIASPQQKIKMMEYR